MTVKGFGTLLEHGNTADYATATIWTPVAEAKSIKPPKVTAKEIDTTHLTSPDEFEESEAGLATGGEVEMTLRYDKTQATTAYGFFRTLKSWRIRYPDDSGWKFNGRVIDYGDEEVVNGEIVMTGFKIKVTGKPVHAAVVTA